MVMAFSAAAAARINASLQARKGIQHVDVPPIQSANSGDGQSGEAKSHSVGKEMYTADGDYIQDIEVNDLRNRYLLTKGSTQKMVNILLRSTDFPISRFTDCWYMPHLCGAIWHGGYPAYTWHHSSPATLRLCSY
jgi:hypothetical protein